MDCCLAAAFEAVRINDVASLERIVARNHSHFHANHLFDGKITILHLAVACQHQNAVRSLLTHGADVNIPNQWGNTCLHIAAKTRNLPLLDLVLPLTKDVDRPNRRGLTPLHRAVRHDRYETAMQLLTRGRARVNTQDCDGDSPLHDAACNRNVALMELLLRHGADPNCPNQNAVTPFHEMLKLDSCELLDLFLERGARLPLRDDNGYGALHYAVKFGAFRILRRRLLLPAHQLDVEERTSYGQRTPLHLLFECLARSLDEVAEIARLLVQHGADVNSMDRYGETLLIKAVRMRELGMVRCVLGLGGDPNVHQAFSTLYDAVLQSSAEIVECLVEHGADVHFVDPFERSLLNTAMRREDAGLRLPIVQLLMERGVRVRSNDNLALDGRQFEALNRCERELGVLRRTRVCADCRTTYFDVLVKRGDALVSCLRNRRVVDALESGRHRQRFAYFVERIEANLARGLERMRTLDRAVAVLYDVFGRYLDYNIINDVSKYFGNDEFDALFSEHHVDSEASDAAATAVDGRWQLFRKFGRCTKYLKKKVRALLSQASREHD